MNRLLQKFGKAIVIMIIQLGFFVTLLAATPISAHAANGLFQSSVEQACSGAQAQENATCADGSNTINSVIKTALNLLSIVAGVAAVIMIIVAGIRYATSGGDSSGISGAKNTIIYAIVGLTVVALSQLIVQFVVNKLK